jgi:hypothetical protein
MSYADWVRRFFDYVSRRQSVEHPRVTSESVRDFLTHLAVHPSDSLMAKVSCGGSAASIARMPGLNLTLEQAMRMWSVERQACLGLLESLIVRLPEARSRSGYVLAQLPRRA